MSASGACLSTAIFAAAALLGRPYIQIMVSGQAAVGVVVSTVQLVSAAISVWGASPKTAAGGIGEGVAEEQAARIFFGVSILFMASTLAAHLWLTRQPLYKSTVGRADMHKPQPTIEDTDERRGLLAVRPSVSLSDAASDVLQVFKANFIFMFSVACTFVVTLVRTPICCVRVILIVLTRPYTLPSQFRCYRQIRMCTRSFLPLSTSWHSM